MNAPGKNRIAIWVAGCALLLGALEWRLFVLQHLRHEELQEKAENYRFTSRVEQAWRGPIQDRNGYALAMTVPVKDLYADLAVWTNRVDPLARMVGPLLKMDPSVIAQRVRQRLSPTGQWATNHEPAALLLKPGVPAGEWTLIHAALVRENFGFQTNRLSSRDRTTLKGLRRWTLFARDNQRRYAPQGESLGPVLGFVGTGSTPDDHLLEGKWGLEAWVNSALSGRNGFRTSSQDAAGNELAFCRTTNVTVVDGARFTLTIDLKLQEIVECALARAVAAHHPSNASCIVIQPVTGEILAMASLPSFAPDRPAKYPPSTWRNHAISDRNEVGSVFKVITLAMALDCGVVNLDQSIFCENGAWTYKKSLLHDDGHRYGALTVRDCLAKSSNIGLAKIGLLVGTNRFYDGLLRFGFARPTGLPLPYETAGLLRTPSHWSAGSIAYLSIGHELGVSQIQLAMAYAAIANDGKLMKPLLVKQVNRADGSLWRSYAPEMVRTVIRPETAQRVREAMRAVVEHGTGKLAALPQYSVAGKTGTAQKSDGHRVLSGREFSSFVGMFPASRPALVIAVALDDPANAAYGGTVAAPVFREIAEQAARLYAIPPDRSTEAPPPEPLKPVGNPSLVALRMESEVVP